MGRQRETEQARRLRFEPEVVRILRHNLPVEPTPTVMVRIRRHSQLKYRGRDAQFTIRGALASGGRTEYHRIMAGEADYLLYAFADEADQHLQCWGLVDLAVLRSELDYWPAERLRARLKWNSDGKTALLGLKYAEFPPAILVAEQGLQLPTEASQPRLL